MRYDIIIDKYFNCWLCDNNFSMMQSWSLEPEAGCRIELTFDSVFDIDHKKDRPVPCNWDWVRISYGSFNEKFCGHSIQETPFTGGKGETMKVEFYSDSSEKRIKVKGFMATWKSVYVATVDTPVTTCTKGISHTIKALHV